MSHAGGIRLEGHRGPRMGRSQAQAIMARKIRSEAHSPVDAETSSE